MRLLDAYHQKLGKLLNVGVDDSAKAYLSFADYILFEIVEPRTIAELRSMAANGAPPIELAGPALAYFVAESEEALGLRPFRTQLAAAMAMIDGDIVQMSTGEGKTLSGALAAGVLSLYDQVHMVTANDYLAERDAEFTQRLVAGSGLVVTHNTDSGNKSRVYAGDIVYGNSSVFGFDFLRDSLLRPGVPKAQAHGLPQAVVDEADAVLLDDATTPMIISQEAPGGSEYASRAVHIASLMQKGRHYTLELNTGSLELTDEGVDYIEDRIGLGILYTIENIHYIQAVENAIRAREYYLRGRDYAVIDRQVVLISTSTGRLMEGRRLSGGLHQAIEAKEGVPILQDTISVSQITVQQFFGLYGHLAGMTGTADTSDKEFYKSYKLSVTAIPRNRPSLLETWPRAVYVDCDERDIAVVDEAVNEAAKGRPVLIAGISQGTCERISERLNEIGAKHELLAAETADREAEIIQRAGMPGAITVATNIAGRGVDIVPGGPDASDELKERVHDSGGLHVIGVELNESTRVDRQLIGRAGRQGAPGSARLYASLDDDFVHKGVSADHIEQVRRNPKPRALNALVDLAQQSSESARSLSRSTMQDFAASVEGARRAFRDLATRPIRDKQTSRNWVEENLPDVIASTLAGLTEGYPESWDLDAIAERLHEAFGLAVDRESILDFVDGWQEALSEDALTGLVSEKVMALLDEDDDGLALSEACWQGMLDAWPSFLDYAEHLRAAISWRQVAGQTPKVEYSLELKRAMDQCAEQWRIDVVRLLLKADEV